MTAAADTPLSHAFPALPPVRLDAQGRIDVDVPCPGCGYNLRMRSVGQACPECGRGIEVARNEDGLTEADGRWRGSLSSGAWWLHAGVIGALPLVYPGLALAAVGVWKLTAPEPGRTPRRSEWVQRVLARWLTVIGVGASIGAVAWAGYALWTRRGVGGSGWSTIDFVLSGTHCAAFIGLMWAWRYVFNLAARADAPEVAVALRVLWRKYFYGLLAVAGIAMLVNVWDALDLYLTFQRGSVWAIAPLTMTAMVLGWLWWATLRSTSRVTRALRIER